MTWRIRLQSCAIVHIDEGCNCSGATFRHRNETNWGNEYLIISSVDEIVDCKWRWTYDGRRTARSTASWWIVAALLPIKIVDHIYRGIIHIHAVWIDVFVHILRHVSLWSSDIIMWIHMCCCEARRTGLLTWWGNLAVTHAVWMNFTFHWHAIWTVYAFMLFQFLRMRLYWV